MQHDHNTPENGANPQKSRILEKAESLTEAEAQRTESALEIFQKLSPKARELLLEFARKLPSKNGESEVQP